MDKNDIKKFFEIHDKLDDVVRSLALKDPPKTNWHTPVPFDGIDSISYYKNSAEVRYYIISGGETEYGTKEFSMLEIIEYAAWLE